MQTCLTAVLGGSTNGSPGFGTIAASMAVTLLAIAIMLAGVVAAARLTRRSLHRLALRSSSLTSILAALHLASFLGSVLWSCLRSRGGCRRCASFVAGMPASAAASMLR